MSVAWSPVSLRAEACRPAYFVFKRVWPSGSKPGLCIWRPGFECPPGPPPLGLRPRVALFLRARRTRLLHYVDRFPHPQTFIILGIKNFTRRRTRHASKTSSIRGRVWDQKVGSPFGTQSGGQKMTPGLGPGASTQPGVGGGCARETRHRVTPLFGQRQLILRCTN